MSSPPTPRTPQLFKVIIVGDSGVGKTNILLRYISNKFTLAQNPTIGFEFYVKDLQLHNEPIKMQIWDTAGQDIYRSMTHIFYKWQIELFRNAIGALVVFNLGNKQSFRGIGKWITEIRDHAMEEVVMVLIGNKNDLVEREVETEEALGFAENQGMAYFETSAKENTNVEESFDRLFKEIYKQYTHKKTIIIEQEYVELPAPSILKLDKTKKKRKVRKDEGMCCV